MVISLIKNAFGGNPSSSQASASQAQAMPEEIPDELPPLMEDLAPEKKPEPVSSAPSQLIPSHEEAPGTLPQLGTIPQSAPSKVETVSRFAANDDQFGKALEEFRMTPGEEDNASVVPPKEKQREQTHTSASDLFLPEEVPKPVQRQPVEQPKIEAPTQQTELLYDEPSGFFEALKNIVSKSQFAMDEVLTQDLVTRMKSYWSAKHDLKEGIFDDERSLLDEFETKIKSLRAIESRWRVQALALEHEREELHRREQELKQKAKELQEILRAMRFYRKVPLDLAFVTCTGMKICSLKELFDALSIVDETTLQYHITTTKNDFADWILHVLNDKELALSMHRARTRGTMLKALESLVVTRPRSLEPSAYPERTKHAIVPERGFLAINGKIILALEELPRAIREFTDTQFEHHVNRNRNDFSKWVADVFGMQDLSARMKLATTRQELLDVLEVYL